MATDNIHARLFLVDFQWRWMCARGLGIHVVQFWYWEVLCSWSSDSYSWLGFVNIPLLFLHFYPFLFYPWNAIANKLKHYVHLKNNKINQLYFLFILFHHIIYTFIYSIHMRLMRHMSAMGILSTHRTTRTRVYFSLRFRLTHPSHS